MSINEGSKPSAVSEFPDAFSEKRQSTGIGYMDDQNDPVTMLLRLKDVRKTAHTPQVFQSGAKPGRIVIPSEVNIRETRQIPFELDPPEHGGFRKLLDPWFKRPLQADYQAALQSIIDECIDAAINQEKLDLIEGLALPLQSRALTILLNTPMAESQTWIDWGTHVFRSESSALDADKANILYDYIDQQIDKAIAAPSDDLYSVLLASKLDGKQLTKEEVKGVLVLTFAGGRDTVINAVTNTFAYFSEHPEQFALIKQSPELIDKAVEELIRYFAPLTQMGRVALEDTNVCEHPVKANTRVSLCWAAANRDESVFEDANTVNFERKKNPHVSFGFSHHNCLGANHARQIMRQLLATLAIKVQSIEVHEALDNIETMGEFSRKVGFYKLIASLHAE